MKFEIGRQAVFTQQEVTEMQKGNRSVLESLEKMLREIRYRSLSGFDVKDVAKTAHEEILKQIDIINEDIKIETSSDQAI